MAVRSALQRWTSGADTHGVTPLPRHGRGALLLMSAAMKSLSIRTLLAALLLVTVTPLLFYTVRTLSSVSDVSRVRAEEAALGAAATATGVVEEFITHTEFTLARIREELDDGTITEANCVARLARVRNLDQQAINYHLVNADGDVMCSGGPDLREALPNLAHQKWFQRVREEKTFLVGTPVRGVIIETWMVTFTYPILVDGEFRGAVNKVVDLAEFQNLLAVHAQTMRDAVLTIADDSLLVARSEGGEEHIGRPLPKPTFERESGDGSYGVTHSEDLNGNPRMWAFRTIPKAGWTLYAGLPVSSVAATEQAAIQRAILVGVLVMLLAMALGMAIYVRITRSLDWLVRSAETAVDHRGEEETPPMPTEIARVVQQIRKAVHLRRKAESRLHDANARFATIADTAGFGIIVLANPSGQVELVNDAMADMLRMPVYQLLDFTAADFFVDPQDHRVITELQDSAPQADGIETRLMRADGTHVPVRLSWGTFVDRDSEEKIGVVVEDITKQSELEHQFRHAQKMEAVGRLAAGIAHDYNNILTIVNGQAELALEDIAEEHPAHPSVIDIFSAGQRAAQLTQRLLAFSRPDAPQNCDFDLNGTVEGVTSMLRRLVGEEIELHLLLANEPLKACGDAAQIEQVLLNLTINARDALRSEGRIVVSTGTEDYDVTRARDILGAEEGSYVFVKVSDNGHGMDESTRLRIFEPFFTTKDAGVGTGLGMSTVYSIVKKAGGFLTVDSQVGAGTDITVFLPSIGTPVEA